MESITDSFKISAAFDNVRKLSFEEKKAVGFDESKINKLLDSILDFKTVFKNKTNTINALVEKIEEITWLNNIDNDALILINDLISAIRDLHTSLSRQYISVNFILNREIAKEEINNFKAAIDDLKEVAADLESRFFFLPNLADFQETSKELSLI